MKRLFASLTFLLTSMSFAARVVLPELPSGEVLWNADQATIRLDQDGKVELQGKGQDEARVQGQTMTLTQSWGTVFSGNLVAGSHPIEGLSSSAQFRVNQGRVSYPALNFRVQDSHFQPLMLLSDVQEGTVLKLEARSGVEPVVQITDSTGRTQVVSLPAEVPLNKEGGPYLVSGRQSQQDSEASVLQTSLSGDTLDLYPVDETTPAFVSVVALLNLPDEPRSMGTQATLNGKTVQVPANGTVLVVEPGIQSLQGNPQKGTVLNAPAQVQLQGGESGLLRLEYVPQTQVTLTAEKDAASLSEGFVFKAVASTDFDSLIPATLSIQLPEGFTSQEALEVTRPIKKDRPAELVVQAMPSRSGLATVTAQLSPFGTQATQTVTVYDSSLLQVDVVPSTPLADPGGEMTLKVTVRNSGTVPSGALELSSMHDAGISTEALNETFSLKAGEEKTFVVPVKVSPIAPGQVVYRTLLKSDTGETRTETRLGIQQAQLEMQVSGVQSPALPGEQQTIRIGLKNTGTRTANYTLKNDAEGFLKPLTESEFSGTLAPGEETSHVFLAETTYGAEATGTLRSTVTSEAGEQVTTLPVQRALVQFDLSLNRSGIRMGEDATYTLKIKNPLPRPIAFRLEGKHDDTVQLSEQETRLIQLEAFEETVLEWDARFSKPGSVVQQFTAFMGETVVAQPVELSTDVLNVYTLTRESEFELPFVQNSTAQDLLLGHLLPEGSVYVAGSSTLNGEPLPDPLIGNSGTLYWKVKALSRGTLKYQVTHQRSLENVAEPLVVALVQNREPETLSGTFHLSDYQFARPIEARTENSGAIKLPLAGTVVRNRDRISVKVQLPADQSADLQINGQPVPDSSVGLRSLDPDTGTSTYEYVGLELQKGKNTLTLGQEQIEVFLAGAPEKLTVEPVQNLADGITPIRFKIVARDASGLPSGEGFVDVLTTLEPGQPDMNPFEGGYQVRMLDGEALLELRPTTSTRPVALTLKFGPLESTLEVPLQFSTRQVGIGMASITAHVSPFQVQGKGAAYLETPLGNGQLQLAINSAGLEKNTQQNFALRGDASIEEQPLYGDTPIAFQYDHPEFKLAYREGPVPVDALPIPQTHVYLSGQTTDLTPETPQIDQLSAFVGLVPGHKRTFEITPVGARTYALPDANIDSSSERVELVTTIKGEETVRLLNAGTDYVMDYVHGIIEFGQPLVGLDDELNPVRIRVTYTTAEDTTHFAAWGVQVSSKTDNASVKLAAVRLPEGSTATVVFSAKSDISKVEGQSSTDYSGYRSVASASLNNQPWSVSLKGGVQSEGYKGLDKQQDGVNLNLQASYRFDRNWSWLGQADYDTFAKAEQASLRTGFQYKQDALSGSVRLGKNFGIKNNLSLFLGAAYEQDNWNVAVDQQFNFSSEPHTTTFRANYKLDRTTQLVFKDEYTWGGNNRAFVGLESTLGNTSYAIGYELPNSSGDGNRARLNGNTTLQLDDLWSVDLKGSLSGDLSTGKGSLGTGTTLKYTTRGLNASLGLDYSDAGSGSKFSVKAAMTGKLDSDWTLGFDGLKEFGTEGLGTRLNLNVAGRMNASTVLGSVQYADGTLARSAPQFSAHVAGNYVQPGYQIRGQLDARHLLNDPSAFTIQGLAGANLFITDKIGLGAVVRYMTQPGTGTQAFGYGIEGSVNVWNGVWATVGYNPRGFTGIAPIDSQAGFYFRLDFLLDENSFKNEDQSKPEVPKTQPVRPSTLPENPIQPDPSNPAVNPIPSPEVTPEQGQDEVSPETLFNQGGK